MRRSLRGWNGAEVVRLPVSRAEPRPPRARRADAPPARRTERRCRSPAQHAQHGARVPGSAAGDDDPRRDLQALPGNRGAAERRRAAPGAGRRAAVEAGTDRLGGVARRHRPLSRRGAGARRRDSQRARAAGERRRTLGRRPAAAVRSRSCAHRPHGGGEAPAQEPRTPDRRVRLARHRRHARRSRVRDAVRSLTQATGRRAGSVPRLARRRSARRPLPHRDLLRPPVAGRGVRAAGTRGDDARHSGCLLPNELAAGGRRRGRADSTRSTPARSQTRSRASSPTTSSEPG